MLDQVVSGRIKMKSKHRMEELMYRERTLERVLTRPLRSTTKTAVEL